MLQVTLNTTLTVHFYLIFFLTSFTFQFSIKINSAFISAQYTNTNI